jgi:hypothetical protein
MTVLEAEHDVEKTNPICRSLNAHKFCPEKGL